MSPRGRIQPQLREGASDLKDIVLASSSEPDPAARRQADEALRRVREDAARRKAGGS